MRIKGAGHTQRLASVVTRVYRKSSNNGPGNQQVNEKVYFQKKAMNQPLHQHRPPEENHWLEKVELTLCGGESNGLSMICGPISSFDPFATDAASMLCFTAVGLPRGPEQRQLLPRAWTNMTALQASLPRDGCLGYAYCRTTKFVCKRQS